jgi:cell division initiation protein
MVLSPQDIQNKEFSVKMRGYNIDEVNDFLDRIVKDYNLTLSENVKLKNQLKDVNSQLDYFNGMKDSMNQSIIVAQNAADKVRSDAQTEANKMSEYSRKQADKILNDASQKAKTIIENVSNKSKTLLTVNNDLKQTTESFRAKLQNLLQAQMDLVNSSKWDEVTASVEDSYKDTMNQINNLDIVKDTVVKSDSNEASRKKTIIIYPDGSFNIVK